MSERNPASLYDFVRETLEFRGGSCSRRELLAAIQAHPRAASLLECGQGYTRLLLNMKHSGFVELEGDWVRRTKRRVGLRHL